LSCHGLWYGCGATQPCYDIFNHIQYENAKYIHVLDFSVAKPAAVSHPPYVGRKVRKKAFAKVTCKVDLGHMAGIFCSFVGTVLALATVSDLNIDFNSWLLVCALAL
jgi:hypothetical protein